MLDSDHTPPCLQTFRQSHDFPENQAGLVCHSDRRLRTVRAETNVYLFLSSTIGYSPLLVLHSSPHRHWDLVARADLLDRVDLGAQALQVPRREPLAYLQGQGDRDFLKYRHEVNATITITIYLAIPEVPAALADQL